MYNDALREAFDVAEYLKEVKKNRKTIKKQINK